MHMRLTIDHQTRYRYENPVPFGLQQVRLTPKSRPGQRVHDWKLEVESGKVELHYEDHHLNTVHLVSFEPGATEIVVHSRGEVETEDLNGVIGRHVGMAPLWLFESSTPRTRIGPGVRRLVRELGDDFDGDVARLHALSALIASQVTYKTGETHAMTDAETAIADGWGVCQDHAHIFCAAARQMGYPARYISGYLMMNDRVEQEAGHAWAEAHLPGLGWVGFDVSNAISPDARYVRVASGLDYADCAPTTGLRRGAGSEHLIVSLQVQQ